MVHSVKTEQNIHFLIMNNDAKYHFHLHDENYILESLCDIIFTVLGSVPDLSLELCLLLLLNISPSTVLFILLLQKQNIY